MKPTILRNILLYGAGKVGAFLIPAIFLMLGIALSSCDHKELCYHHDHYSTFRIEYDWRDAPDATPAGMVVFFYPMDPTQETLRFDFTGKEGGEIKVPYGYYRILTYNNDTSGVYFSNPDDPEAHTAFTRAAGVLDPLGVSSRGDGMARLRAEGSEEERVVLTPDMMWGCNAVDVLVNETGISYICVPESEKDIYIGKDPVHTEYVVTLYPHELTCIYTYEIRNVRNHDRISRCSATLSGMSPAIRLLSEELDMESVTHPLDAAVDHDKATISGIFYTFGHHENNPDPHKMVVYILTKDNKALYFGSKDPKFDVTTQVHEAPDKRRVHIIIDGLDIPDGEIPQEPTELDPGVDDWVPEETEIPL